MFPFAYFKHSLTLWSLTPHQAVTEMQHKVVLRTLILQLQHPLLVLDVQLFSCVRLRWEEQMASRRSLAFGTDLSSRIQSLPPSRRRPAGVEAELPSPHSSPTLSHGSIALILTHW